LGSVRAEGLQPSEELLEDLDSAVRGEIDADEVVSRAVERARRARARA
jgi:hypothetical protein